jgi:hypothetical protein
MIRYVISYEWGEADNESLMFNSETPFYLPAVGDLVYLDPNVDGLGPRRTLFMVHERVFEVQRGTHASDSIHTAYLSLTQQE